MQYMWLDNDLIIPYLLIYQMTPNQAYAQYINCAKLVRVNLA